MSTVLRLELPDELARRAVALASATNRRIEDAIVEWIGRAVADPAVEALSDDELLTVCDSTLAATDQERLSELLTAIRERQLTSAEQAALDQLMSTYRAGMVRKACAIKEAVARGLRPGLGEDAT
jgi:hypothetical protein